MPRLLLQNSIQYSRREFWSSGSKCSIIKSKSENWQQQKHFYQSINPYQLHAVNVQKRRTTESCRSHVSHHFKYNWVLHSKVHCGMLCVSVRQRHHSTAFTADYHGRDLARASSHHTSSVVFPPMRHRYFLCCLNMEKQNGKTWIFPCSESNEETWALDT